MESLINTRPRPYGPSLPSLDSNVNWCHFPDSSAGDWAVGLRYSIYAYVGRYHPHGIEPEKTFTDNRNLGTWAGADLLHFQGLRLRPPGL